MNQFELRLEPVKPEVNDWEVELMCVSLLDSGIWLTAGDLIQKHNMANTEQSRRVLRAMAEASNGRIISGQLGYKHNAHATPEERDRAVKALRSQAMKMQIRAHCIELYATSNGLN